eukprot:359194-Chlamydomonas_euryale.AAC.11
MALLDASTHAALAWRPQTRAGASAAARHAYSWKTRRPESFTAPTSRACGSASKRSSSARRWEPQACSAVHSGRSSCA